MNGSAELIADTPAVPVMVPPKLNGVKLPPYRLASRMMHAESSVIRVGNAVIGGSTFTVIAGPCSVESEYQLLETARKVTAAGAGILRGGAFKPRSSPYSFQGMEEEGLKLLASGTATPPGFPLSRRLWTPATFRSLKHMPTFCRSEPVTARTSRS